MDGVTLVVGNSHKTRIPEFVSEPLRTEGSYHGQIEVGDIFAQTRFSFGPGGRCAGRSHAAESEDSGWLQ